MSGLIGFNAYNNMHISEAVNRVYSPSRKNRKGLIETEASFKKGVLVYADNHPHHCHFYCESE